MSQPNLIRLNKRLVELSLANSRRSADELIKQGQVSINGQIVTALTTKVSQSDSIKAQGKLGRLENDIAIVFNKPKGYVCTHKAQGSQETIYQLLPKKFSRLKCAGRLDKDSQGLMILSSNGYFVQQMSHPSSAKEKEYIVSTVTPLSQHDISRLRSGIKLDDGMSYFKLVKKINSNTLRLVLTTGRNRQIRRSFEAIDHTITKLERVRIDNYKIGTLAIGKHKFIEMEKPA